MRLPLYRRDPMPAEASPTFGARTGPGVRPPPTMPAPRQPNVPLPRQRLVTVSVEDSVARFVVVRGKQVLTWWTADLAGVPSPAGQGGDGHGPLPPSRPPLAAYAMPSGRVVTDLPLRVPLMRHFMLSKVGNRYLEQVALSEILDSIPFPAEDVDISWQARKVGDEREVFAVAVAKQAMDNHVQQLRAAGLRPRAAYAKAVALACVAGVPDAVIVNLGLTTASIVLVRGSVPLAIHQVELLEQGVDVVETAAALVQEVDLVAGYHQPLAPNEDDALVPVVLTGLLAARAPLVAALPAALGRDIMPLATPFLYPQGFDPNEYGINLGLALADAARERGLGKSHRTGVPALNLLPARHLPRPLPVRQAGVFLGLALFAAVCIGAKVEVDSKSSEAAALSVRQESMDRRDREQRLSLLRANTMEGRVKAGATTVVALESRLETSRSDMGSTMERLDVLAAQAAPPKVLLSAVGLQGSTFAVAGNAASYEDVLQYVDNLRSSGAFVEVRTTRMDALATGEGSSGTTVPSGSAARTGTAGLPASSGGTGGAPDAGAGDGAASPTPTPTPTGAGTVVRLPQPVRPKVSFQIKAIVASPAPEAASKTTSK